MNRPGVTRRQGLAGAAVVGVAPLLAACGDDGGQATLPAESSTSASPSQPPSSSPSPTEPASTPAAEPPPDALTSAADVPEGGGTIFADEEVVVTQPAAGEFKGFTAVCTHRGCVVSSVDDGTINCACHGSRFSIADGSVQNGPATSGLAEVPLAVEGGSISLA